jgi:Fur family peroxide stress response transcriptional regulator
MVRSTRYSRKREAILDAIRSTDTHPSADWVYQTLRPRYPDLSLGTVYRNLTKFKEEGLIVSVGTVNGQERFDATVSPHTHLICRDCGKVMDLPQVRADQALQLDTVAQLHGVEIDRCELILYGKCSQCAQQKNLNFDTGGNQHEEVCL